MNSIVFTNMLSLLIYRRSVQCTMNDIVFTKLLSILRRSCLTDCCTRWYYTQYTVRWMAWFSQIIDFFFFSDVLVWAFVVLGDTMHNTMYGGWHCVHKYFITPQFQTFLSGRLLFLVMLYTVHCTASGMAEMPSAESTGTIYPSIMRACDVGGGGGSGMAAPFLVF